MAKDIPTQLIGIAGLWPATLLYGVNIVMFIICVLILTQKRSRGEATPWFLLGAISLQALLCTAHITCMLGAAVNAFRTVPVTGSAALLVHTWISPLGHWTATQQLMHTFNNFVGDSILIWRLYVVYGNSWLVCAVPIALACAELACNLYTIITTFVNPAYIVASLQGNRTNTFDQLVVAGFALMGSTQVLVTILLATKIYMASASLRSTSRPNGRYLSTYSSLMWMLVESGAAMAFIDIIWIATWKAGLGGIAQFILAIIGQTCALVPYSIIARVGLRLAFNGTTEINSGSNGSKYVSGPNSATSATLSFRARPGTGTNMTSSVGPASTELKDFYRDEYAA